MKKLIALALVASSASAESMNGIDKQLHFAGSAGMSAVASVIFQAPKDNLTPFLLALSIGLAKEISDSLRKGGSGFSRNDLLADSLGAYAGSVAGNGTMFFVSGNRRSISIKIFKLF